jgi:hypothetical protein
LCCCFEQLSCLLSLSNHHPRYADIDGLSVPVQVIPYWNGNAWVNGTQQTAYVYGTPASNGVAFLENDGGGAVTVRFAGANYTLGGASSPSPLPFFKRACIDRNTHRFY